MLLGGILTSGLNWRWVLFVNVPIGLASAALAPRTLVESRADDDTSTFDLPGAATVTAGLSLLVYAIVNAVNVGSGSSGTLLLIAGALVLLIAFLLIESRQRKPLMPFSIVRLRTLRGADIVGLLLGMSVAEPPQAETASMHAAATKTDSMRSGARAIAWRLCRHASECFVGGAGLVDAAST